MMDAAAEKDDWVTAPVAKATEEKDDWVTAPAAKAKAEQSAPPTVDDYGRPVDAAPATGGESAIGNIAGAAVDRAKAAFGDPSSEPNPVLSPLAQEGLDSIQRGGGVKGKLAQIGSTIAGDIGTGINYAKAAGGALIGAYQGGVSQAGIEVGAPQFGRDLAALPEAFPTGDFHGGTAMPVAGIKASAMATEQRLASAKISAIGAATDIDGAIAAAGAAATAPVEAATSAAVTAVESPQVRLLRQTEGAILRRVAGDESKLTDAEGVRLRNIRAKMDEMQGPKEAPAEATVDPTAAPDAGSGAPVSPTADSAAAPIPTGWSIDDRFGQAGQAPDASAPAGITASQVQRRDGVGYNEAVRRAAAENAVAPTPQSAGAAASRDMTHPSQIEMPPAEFAANRAQGEVERLAQPPALNDQSIYIPGTKPTLAEVSGNPHDAMDQAYNRQQPEAMTQHIAQENHNADAVADYYADTAGSAPTLLRMERSRDATAQQNIQSVFGDPQSTRAPADPSKTISLMDGMLNDPRQAERNSVVKILSSLADKFYGEDGALKTDPYALYGIGEHINDLLRGTGDTETSGAARVLKRELTQIKESLYNDIEDAAPGFAKYRADYQRDSQAIDAMKLLQDARLSLLSGTNQHITPAKWFSFMRGIVEGRADPMDAASALSESQMDRLWNITNQLKRSTLIDAGKPRGSWTSMMQEWGGRFGRLAAHGIAATTFPVVGNLGVEMGVAGLRKRSVTKEMNRVLNPDLGQTPHP